MSVPVVEELSDERITSLQHALTVLLQSGDDGFANNTLLRSELAALLIEVQRGRRSAVSDAALQRMI